MYNESWHCPAKISTVLLKKEPVSLVAAHVSPKSVSASFIHMQVTDTMGLGAPEFHHRCWLLHLSLKTAWKHAFASPQNTLPLCFSPSDTRLSPKNLAVFLHTICVPSSLLSRFLGLRFRCCII